ncbi:MAG TPA: hypothetical protein VK102_06550 [Sphingobacterium sp.]|nr:hypothetical protein [Sphingobacterium sp.]
MENEALIIQVQKHIKENRHSLSDEDIKLLKRIIVALKDVDEKPNMDNVKLLHKTAQICDLFVRLFTDN